MALLGETLVARIPSDDLASSRPCAWERARVSAVGEAVAVDIGLPGKRGTLRAHSDPRAGLLPEQTNDHVLAGARGRHAAADRDPVLGGPHLDDGARLRVVVDDGARRLAGRDRRPRRRVRAGSGTASRCARGLPSPCTVTSIVPIGLAGGEREVAGGGVVSPWWHSRSRRVTAKSTSTAVVVSPVRVTENVSVVVPEPPSRFDAPSRRGPRTPAGSDRCRRSSRHRSRCRAWR